MNKKNTICIEGDSNAGKSFFVNSLANLIWSVGYVESNINFPFKNLLGKRIGVIREFTCSKPQFQNLKELFKGAQFNCAVKHKFFVSNLGITIIGNAFIYFVRKFT